TRIYKAVSEGVQVTITTILQDGESSTVQHPVNYDGKEHPVRGGSQADAIVLQKIDDYTAESTLKHAAKVSVSNRRRVTPAGKTMTITYQGTDWQGRAVKNTAVYEKQ